MSGILLLSQLITRIYLGKAPFFFRELPFSHTFTMTATWELLRFYMTSTTVSDQEVITPSKVC